MEYRHLVVAEHGPVVRATMNRPEALNALNPELAEDLGRFFRGLAARDDLRVVVLRGAGRAFCAGFDLKSRGDDEARRLNPSQVLSAQRKFRDIVIAMRRCPQPIIGLIDGPACGGGFSIALATDVRLATPAARMNAAFIRIGFTACDMGLSYFLPRMVGSSAAAEYMLTGRFIDAQQALALRLVSRIVAPERLDEEADALVEDMLRTSPLGLRLTKDALGHAADGHSLEAVIAMEDRNQALCVFGEDFEEAMSAWMEKRAPRFAEPGAGTA